MLCRFECSAAILAAQCRLEAGATSRISLDFSPLGWGRGFSPAGKAVLIISRSRTPRSLRLQAARGAGRIEGGSHDFGGAEAPPFQQRPNVVRVRVRTVPGAEVHLGQNVRFERLRRWISTSSTSYMRDRPRSSYRRLKTILVQARSMPQQITVRFDFGLKIARALPIKETTSVYTGVGPVPHWEVQCPLPLRAGEALGHVQVYFPAADPGPL